MKLMQVTQGQSLRSATCELGLKGGEEVTNGELQEKACQVDILSNSKPKRYKERLDNVAMGKSSSMACRERWTMWTHSFLWEFDYMQIVMGSHR